MIMVRHIAITIIGTWISFGNEARFADHRDRQETYVNCINKWVRHIFPPRQGSYVGY